MPLTPGSRLGPYEILQPIGAGGMGEVHRARHLKLGRDVAIKVLPTELAADRSRLAWFEREARTASALNHPNIVTIHDVAEHEGTTYIAMELVEGRTLRELIARGPLPIDRALGLAGQIADGLAKAHAAGIVHRDIKPANVMVTVDDLVKILDFGLAKPLPTDGREVAGPTLTETREGVIVGTPHYMSPEQLSGDPVDHRSDQFAFGVLLYEMLGGKPPFDGPSMQAIISAILVKPTPPLRQLRAEVPADLEQIIGRCLEKEADRRFPSTAELGAELRRCADRRTRAGRGLVATLRRPAVAGTLAALVLALGLAGWLRSRGTERRWAENDALEEITALIERGDLYDAYRTALEAEKYRPGDPEIQKMVARITLPLAVNTDPPGAEVSVKGYATPDAEWERLGVTPLTLRIPYAMMRWRITKAGYEPFEGAPSSGPALMDLASGLLLDSVDARPRGTVRVPAGLLEELPEAPLPDQLPAMMIDAFFLDQYEVTNRQFREFVAAGGYRRQEWWPSPIVREGREIPWQEAIDRFRDPAGEYGPSTWELGGYPVGEDDHPVGGISWYEAAAYCAFAGKSLPTVYHWFRAIGQDQLSDILVHSNMDSDRKAPVGRFKGLSAYGSYDMAGNVKEWVWNATGSDRYILGGAWNEPTYLFKHLIAQDPWGREATYGVRCASYPSPPGEELFAPVTPRQEITPLTPISDEAFGVLRGMYAYDALPLEPFAEREEDFPGYLREIVSINAAYGRERMAVHLLIPRDVAPPYQSVIWYPGDDAFLLPSSDSYSSAYLFDFLPRGGRVLVYPVYKGLYERAEPWVRSPSGMRDMIIRWSQDVSRTIDYLETRPDFDATKIGYYGFSAGASYGPVFTAVEPRIGASILLGGGLVPFQWRPEVNPVHFAPRSRTPTLMINGVDDFLMPYELSQAPLLAMLGAPADMKRHARLTGGHIPTNRLELIREVLDWLDLQFGPVERAATVASAGPEPQ
ncbi:MAG TPA: protein kinase [Gemmatimonadaceae bacterium]|nr:protein kinase [Gemmatimonadaceae bacterium]